MEINVFEAELPKHMKEKMEKYDLPRSEYLNFIEGNMVEDIIKELEKEENS